MTHLILIVLGSVLLWAAGTVFFDFVHWVLHRMLRSRWRLLRLLAWPHAVHHRWLDQRLAIHWELQRRNVFCHLVPEYLTQVAFCAATWLVLPAGVVLGCFALQTAVFIGLLFYRGLDINHRPVEILDAHRPSIFAPPAYHALHHVHPDCYFSAYGKLVDLIVGGGCAVAGRRFHLCAETDSWRQPLASELRRRGAEVAPDGSPAVVRGDEVLVLLPDAPAGSAAIETFLAACNTAQLPPEVWDTRPDVELGTIRFYARDPRVVYRYAPVVDGQDPSAFAHRTLFWLARGLHYVPADARRGLATWRQLRRTAPQPPGGAPFVRSRKALAAAA